MDKESRKHHHLQETEKLHESLKRFIKGSQEKLLSFVPKLFDEEKAGIIIKRGYLDESEAEFLANRKETPSEVLKLIAETPELYQHYSVKVALAKNPKTPLGISKALLGFLLKRDLYKLINSKEISSGLRKISIDLLQKKLPEIPLGEKISMAKNAPRDLLLVLLYDKEPMVLETALWNPRLTEIDIITLMQKKNTVSSSLEVIATHKKWKNRYQVRFYLTKNPKTPFSASVSLLENFLKQDLEILLSNNEISDKLKNEISKQIKIKLIDL